MNTDILYENLIIRMSDGDRDALAELYRHTASAVYGFALSILKNKQDAEDVMHDTYLRAYAAAPAYRPQGKPLSWILTIVRNLCYNRIRSFKVSEDISMYENLAGTDDDDSIDRLILREALEVLDHEERQIVILHALTGLKHREIAEITAMPVGTVLSKYSRALKKLRKELERKGYSYGR